MVSSQVKVISIAGQVVFEVSSINFLPYNKEFKPSYGIQLPHILSPIVIWGVALGLKILFYITRICNILVLKLGHGMYESHIIIERKTLSLEEKNSFFFFLHQMAS